MSAPRNYTWLDLLIAACVAGGLAASALFAVQFRTSTYAGSDFKTLYASVWCFAHRLDAYSIANLQRVFVTNGVVQPERWYAHAPVYPWTTLALLSPLAAVGMVPAAYIFGIASGALLAIALAALMRYAASEFDLGIAWRIAVALLCGCAPLLAFGLAMGNVSVAVCALCFLTFVARERSLPWSHAGSTWLPGAALAIAFVLKPHIALWVGLGMLLLPERAARATAARALVPIAAFTALTAATMAALGTLRMETHSYLSMLAAETSAGASMSAASREALPVVSQITSLEGMVGYWIASPALRMGLTCLMLLGLGLVLVRLIRRVNTSGERYWQSAHGAPWACWPRITAPMTRCCCCCWHRGLWTGCAERR